MDVNHNCPFLAISFRGINIQVETIFISCRTTGSNVVLGTNIAVVSGVEFLFVRLNLNWSLKQRNDEKILDPNS